jgi:hypothetical protein
MVIPHLVLVAMEAVALWFKHEHIARVGLLTRIDRAAGSAAVALVAAMATAAWISRDLRRAAAGDGNPSLTRWELLYRIATFLVITACTAHLIDTTIPHIQEWFLPGVLIALTPRDMAVVVAAFGLLCAGIVARAIGRSAEAVETPPATGRWSRFGSAAAVLFWLGLIVVTVEKILAELGYPPDLLLPSNLLGETAASALSWLVRNWDEYLWGAPLPIVFWFPAFLWAAIETARRCGPTAPDRMASFDAAFLSWARAGKFLGLWTPLSILCLCALPILFVAGLVVYQVRLMRLG